MKILSSIRRIGPNIEKAYREAAALSLSAVLLFVSLFASNHEWITGTLARTIPMALLFLMLALYATTLLSTKKNALFLTAGSLLLTGIVYLLFLSAEQMKPYQWLGYFGSLLLAFFASLLKERTLKAMSEEFVHRLSRAIQTILFGLVIMAGLAFLLLLIDRLIFSISSVWRYYLDIFYGVALLFGVPFFITTSQSPRTEEYPKLFILLVDKFLTPLSYVYTIILYVFFARILITRTWPEGLVSHLVLWYSLFVVALMIVRRARTDRFGWKERFSLMVLPLMGVLFVAIAIRINAYGFTQNRILLMGAALWSTISLLLLGIQKHLRPRWLVYLAMAVVVILMILPTNAWSLGARDQAGRIEKTLIEENMLRDGQVTSKTDLSTESAQRIFDSLAYLRKTEALAFVDYIPATETEEQFQAVFGVRPPTPSWIGTYYSFLRDETKMVSLDGATSMILVSFFNEEELTQNGYHFRFDGRELRIEKDGASTVIDIYDWANDEVQREEPVDWESGSGKLRLILQQVDGDSAQPKPVYSVFVRVFFYD